MAFIRKQEGYYVEYLYPNGTSRFQVDTIVFLVNPYLVYENINHKLFEV